LHSVCDRRDQRLTHTHTHTQHTHNTHNTHTHNTHNTHTQASFTGGLTSSRASLAPRPISNSAGTTHTAHHTSHTPRATHIARTASHDAHRTPHTPRTTHFSSPPGMRTVSIRRCSCTRSRCARR
jgi:hypothetical protein